TVISASSDRVVSLITAGVAAVVEVFSPLSIVSLVERIDVPPLLISTVNMLPVVCAVTREALTSVNVISIGILNVATVPVSKAVDSSEQAIPIIFVGACHPLLPSASVP